jgi:hypothetical protein
MSVGVNAKGDGVGTQSIPRNIKIVYFKTFYVCRLFALGIGRGPANKQNWPNFDDLTSYFCSTSYYSTVS